MLKLGDTFLMPETQHGTEHLYIVISDPDPEGKAVCVNVTTAYAFSEKTCVLQKGDHPFIEHESVIRYQYAKILDLSLVEKALSAKQSKFVCEQRQPCSNELLCRVQEGLERSKMVTRSVKEYFLNGKKNPDDKKKS